MTAVPTHSNNQAMLEAVESFLRSQGWVELPKGANRNATFYSGPLDLNGEPFTVALPAHMGLLDAQERLDAVMRTLAVLEGDETPERFKKRIMPERRKTPRKPRATNAGKIASAP